MGLRLCNGYTSRISTAIMFYSPESCGGEGGDFEIMGWWNLDPGMCVLVYANDLADLNRFWYVYADSSDGAFWTGPFDATVPTDKGFGQCYGVGIGGASSSFQRIGFREIDIGDSDDFTLTFIS